jgi:hypothetical protein
MADSDVDVVYQKMMIWKGDREEVEVEMATWMTRVD